jgi:8-oxo-dGTP pyrophosphatase MutT (NUDIX family)
MAAAVRETEEELGIDSGQVEILGSLAPPQISLRGLRVYPYVVSVIGSLTLQY